MKTTERDELSEHLQGLCAVVPDDEDEAEKIEKEIERSEQRIAELDRFQQAQVDDFSDGAIERSFTNVKAQAEDTSTKRKGYYCNASVAILGALPFKSFTARQLNNPEVRALRDRNWKRFRRFILDNGYVYRKKQSGEDIFTLNMQPRQIRRIKRNWRIGKQLTQEAEAAGQRHRFQIANRLLSGQSNP